MVGAVRLATLGVSDMHIALGLFRDVMRFKIERRGPVPRALLQAWRLPASAEAHMVELSCKGYPVGRLRLVEGAAAAKQSVRLDFGDRHPDSATDVGPKAVHVYVADPILPSVRKIETAGYGFRSRPLRLAVGGTTGEECLFSGPDDVPVLVMVGNKPPLTMRRPGSPDGPFSEIATVSIVAADLVRSRAFYEGVLGLVAVSDGEVGVDARDALADLAGVPRGTRIHLVLYAKPGEASGKIVLMHFFERTGKRLVNRMKPGNLGLAMLTHDTDDINALYAKLHAVGAEVLTPPTLIEGDGAAYRVMVAKGPNEELFEFVQAGVGPVSKVKVPKARTPAVPGSAKTNAVKEKVTKPPAAAKRVPAKLKTKPKGRGA